MVFVVPAAFVNCWCAKSISLGLASAKSVVQCFAFSREPPTPGNRTRILQMASFKNPLGRGGGQKKTKFWAMLAANFLVRFGLGLATEAPGAKNDLRNDCPTGFSAVGRVGCMARPLWSPRLSALRFSQCFFAVQAPTIDQNSTKP